MSNIIYTAEALCAIINGHTIRLPLSHTRALEVVSKLSGAQNWNCVASTRNAERLKKEAIIIRPGINLRVQNGVLSVQHAEKILAQLRTALSEALSE